MVARQPRRGGDWLQITWRNSFGNPISRNIIFVKQSIANYPSGLRSGFVFSSTSNLYNSGTTKCTSLPGWGTALDVLIGPMGSLASC